MFPPQIPSVFIRWLTKPGDQVYDPFCGRGTVPLEAALLGRIGFGSDANPLAVILSSAKVQVPAAQDVASRIDALEAEYRVGLRSWNSLDSVPESISMLYSSGTLDQIVHLRESLDSENIVDQFIIATVLGLMHANHSQQGATRGFSISMPNTFSMAPAYVRSYIQRERLLAPEVDVFDMIRARVQRMDLPTSGINAGRAWIQDASTRAPAWLTETRAKLIFTSPPYLQVIKYGKYNWIRLWFLRRDPGDVDGELMTTSSLSRYLEFIEKVLSEMRSVVLSEGYLCLVIGDVRRDDAELNLADEVWHSVAKPTGWHLYGIVNDHLPTDHKVSRIWKSNRGRATKTDRILILGRERGSATLPPFDGVTWEQRLAWT